jgi:hypothetical protein
VLQNSIVVVKSIFLKKPFYILFFYFPHIKYGKVLVSPPKNKKIKLQILTFYAIYTLKTCLGQENKIRRSSAAVVAVDRNLCHTYSPPLKGAFKARELKFCMQLRFGLD